MLDEKFEIERSLLEDELEIEEIEQMLIRRNQLRAEIINIDSKLMLALKK